jgi:hypothetical protein
MKKRGGHVNIKPPVDCKINGCHSPALGGGGLCRKHYTRERSKARLLRKKDQDLTRVKKDKE